MELNCYHGNSIQNWTENICLCLVYELIIIMKLLMVCVPDLLCSRLLIVKHMKEIFHFPLTHSRLSRDTRKLLNLCLLFGLIIIWLTDFWWSFLSSGLGASVLSFVCWSVSHNFLHNGAEYFISESHIPGASYCSTCFDFT